MVLAPLNETLEIASKLTSLTHFIFLHLPAVFISTQFSLIRCKTDSSKKAVR